MKIINTVYGDATGGRWQAMLNMTEALVSYGHTVTLVSGIENQHLNLDRKEIHFFKNSGFYDFYTAYKVNRWLKKSRPDVIIAHSGRAVYLFKNAMMFGGVNVPVIAMNHSHNVKRTVRADGFIHITPHVAKCVAEASSKKGVKYEEKPQAVISNLIYLPEQKPEFRALGKSITLGMMTRLVDYKGTHLLIDALALLKQKGLEIRLLIAGEGEEKQSLIEQMIRLDLQKQIKFLGWVKGEHKTKFYQEIDIAIVPTMNDTQPLAILDAFAWGKPVIASDHISVQQIIRHGENGLMAKCGDVQSLAERIEQLILNPELTQRLAKQGYTEAVSQYEFKAIAHKLNQFISELK